MYLKLSLSKHRTAQKPVIRLISMSFEWTVNDICNNQKQPLRSALKTNTSKPLVELQISFLLKH